MTARPLTITGGKLVLHHGVPQPGGLRCEAGLIVALGDIAPQPGDEVLDARGAEDKRLPFADAEPGMAGAETLLPLTLTLVRDGHIGMTHAFALLAANPASLLGVKAGQLKVGMEADLALVEPERPWIVDRGKMAATAGNTPFDRRPVEGRVTALFKGGNRVA